MRRTGLLIAGWALATVFALILGLQGVSAISDSVSSHPKASLTPVGVKAALDRSNSSDDSSSDSSSSSSSSSSDDHGGDPPNASQSGAPSASSDSQESSDSSAAPAATAPEDRTYQLIGGSVGVRFENGEAHLLWATPNAGYSVDSSGSSSSVDVRFESDGHESRLKAFWNDGPQQEIEEKD